ncbi:MAG TPA: UDP-N-acetylmuramoyl-L-alanyl-D-glutamate--2,6-diaminopimelate ligase [Candidatus Nanopelagicales bacterium]
MPDAVTETLRPAPTPRSLTGAGGVLEDLGTDLSGVAGLVVTGVTHDSDAVLPGDLFVALPGALTHGARFAAGAAARGAVTILTDPQGAVLAGDCALPLVVVEEPRDRMGQVAARTYGHPGDRLLLVGVTGTNGKTTVTYLLESALRAAGHLTGVIGTVGTRIDGEHLPTARTTPEATDVHALLALMVERGVTAVAMEVSSHALVLGRVDGLVFDSAVFTNLSHDHLDFHRDMADYYAAKATLFTAHRARAGIVCVDDDWGRRLHQESEVPITSYATTPDAGADWTILDVVPTSSGSTLRVRGPQVADLTVSVRLPGDFNATNALGALACAVSTGVDPEVAAAGIGRCTSVPGRMQAVPDPDADRAVLALVDYAHTPAAVSRAIAAARWATRGRVLVVLGCGGDRDRAKRPEMGRAASELADLVIVTDDNPRSEDPAVIRAAVLQGASARSHSAATVLEIGDRRQAIQRAVTEAGSGDVVLVLGKGHEQGQDVAGVVHPFDDGVELAAALRGPRS